MKYISSFAERAVPWHNSTPDTYFFGNSLVGASGEPDGKWTFLIGPDYTSPNYLTSEKLSVLCEGRQISIDLQMKRLRGTGIFFGSGETEGIRMSVLDFAPPDRSIALRWIQLENSQNRPLTVCAEVVPFEAEAGISGKGVLIKKDTTRYCFGNRETLNWADRCAHIVFAGDCAVQQQGDTFLLTVQPDENGCCTLLHRCAYGLPEEMDEPAEHLLEQTIAWWTEWFAKGRLPDISDQRYADALESLLLSVKMQQNRDGGSIAGIRKYANSYIRDTHGGLRMLLAAGHTEEAARLLRNIHSRWKIAGFIPNWWSMGSDSFIGHSFNNDAAEVTAYYLFMARNYLAASGDSALLEEISPSLDWAAQAQLDWLNAHDFTMDFNGDETEQYCCNEDGQEYGGFIHPDYPWHHRALSFPSMAAALTSLEWYANHTGKELSDELAHLRKKIDEIFLGEDGLHRWSALPDGNGWQQHRGHLTNYLLLPLWIGTSLTDSREQSDARAVKRFRLPNGFLPNCPQCMPGFCGHTLGMFLYAMLQLNDRPAADAAAHTILHSPLLSRYGTVSEFYGPSCIPNGHNCRAFEGGIMGEALIHYFSACNSAQNMLQ